MTNSDHPVELADYTLNEIRRLHLARNTTAPRERHAHRWSRWRRRHIAAAKRCHYHRREAQYFNSLL